MEIHQTYFVTFLVFNRESSKLRQTKPKCTITERRQLSANRYPIKVDLEKSRFYRVFLNVGLANIPDTISIGMVRYTYLNPISKIYFHFTRTNSIHPKLWQLSLDSSDLEPGEAQPSLFCWAYMNLINMNNYLLNFHFPISSQNYVYIPIVFSVMLSSEHVRLTKVLC